MKAEYMDRSITLGPCMPEPGDDIVVCRCEEITQGEIRRAIHDGMYTMTEIKRFLRVEMGLCQGQTCGRLVKNILQREMARSVLPDEKPTARAPMRPVDMGIYGKELER
jgi:bacterioferritin-associated ferredoxin